MLLWVVGGAWALPAGDLQALTDSVTQKTGVFLPVLPAAGRDIGQGIVNGTVISGDHPNVVALGGLDPNGEIYVFCSGSQITNTWVLTAAHCIDGSADVTSYGFDLYILYGDDIFTSGYTDAVLWESSYKNPAYNPTLITDDSGLVEMSDPRPDIPWMVLNDAPVDDSWIGTELDFYGFGLTTDTAQNGGTKRTTQIPIDGVDATVVTTYLAGTNVCFGDSGGPSTYDGPDGPEQVGVNSWVTPGCVGGSAGSARVDSQLGFILGYVPDAALDYKDLPETEAPGQDPAGDRDWLDFGTSDNVSGLGGRWPVRNGAPGDRGCNSTGSYLSYLSLALAKCSSRRR